MADVDPSNFGFQSGGGGGGSASCSYDGVYQTPTGHVSGTTCQSWVDLHFPSQPPNASIRAIPSFGLREFGNDVVNPVIEGRGATGSNPAGTLTLLELFRGNTGGFNLLPNEVNPTAGTWYQRTDTFTITSNQSYTARIADDQGRGDTGSGGYTFTYPFYWGVVDESTDIFDNITQAQILAITGMSKYVQTKGTKSFVSNPTSERFCIMYPASYGALTSVIDNSGFETISDYDIYTYGVVGLDGSTQSYRVYILKNDTTQTDFTNTYYF